MKRKYLCQKHLVSSDRMKHLPTLSSESLLASALPGETLNIFEKKKYKPNKNNKKKTPVTTNSIFQKIWKIIYLKLAVFSSMNAKEVQILLSPHVRNIINVSQEQFKING